MNAPPAPPPTLRAPHWNKPLPAWLNAPETPSSGFLRGPAVDNTALFWGARRLPRINHASRALPLPPLPNTNTTPPAAIPRQPRGIPIITSHPARLRGINLQERLVTLTPSIDSIIGELRAGNLYVRPLGQIGHRPHVVLHPALTSTFTTYGYIGQTGVYAEGHPDSDLYSTTYIDGSSSTLVLSQTLNGVTHGVSLLLFDNIASMYLSETSLVGPNTLLNLGLQFTAWRDKARLGFAGVDTVLNGNVFMAAGGFLQIVPAAAITDMGEYYGPDADQLAAAHGIKYPVDGLHRLEVRRAYNYLLNIRGGAGTFSLAALVRLNISRGKQVIYRTMTSTAQAHRWMFEGKGLRQYFKDRFRALGWKKDIVDIPNQHRPEDFKVGDEVVVTKTGSFIIDSVVGNLSVWAGVQFLARGDLEISVHKLDDDRVEVVYNPTRIRDMAVFGFSPFGPEIDAGGGIGRSYRQGFIFDLRKPAAKEAFHKVLEGQLPPQKYRFEPRDAQFDSEQRLRSLVQKQNADLPEGMQRTYVHVVTTNEVRGGGGAHFGVVPRDLLPSGWTNTLAWHRTTALEKQTITDGHMVDYANVRSTETRRELLWCGINIDEVSAQQRWVSKEGEPRTFTGLTLDAALQRSCVRRLSYNSNLVTPINKAFGTHVEPFTRPGHKQTREVSIRRVFTPAALDGLKRYARLWPPGEPLNHVEAALLMMRIECTARDTGLPLRSLRTMLHDMIVACETKPQVEAVQIFVQRHGLAGFGALQRLIPESAQDHLAINSSSSVYISALTNAQRLRLQYLGPMSMLQSPKKLWARLRSVDTALAKVSDALQDLRADPLLIPIEKPLIKEDLLVAQAYLRSLVKVQLTSEGRTMFAQTLASSRQRIPRDDAPLLYYIEGVDTWLQRAQSLAATYAAPLCTCTDAESLRERWNAVYPLVQDIMLRIEVREDNDGDGIWTPQDLQRDLKVLRRALNLLVGDEQPCGFPGRPPQGILNLAQLQPAHLEALHKVHWHTHTQPSERALWHYLGMLVR